MLAAGARRESRRHGRWDAYTAVALAVFALLAVQTANRQWSSDFFLHRATIEALRDDLSSPTHAITGSTDDWELFSPYSVALATLARLTGWDSTTVLQIAALANLALLLATFRLFVVALTGRRAVATGALVATLCCWGLSPWRWSGALSFNSIGFGLPYPSTFATALAFGGGWALLRYARTHDARWLIVLGGTVVLTVLSHPFTGAWMLVMLGAIALHEHLFTKARWPLLAAAVVVLVLVVLWPYFSVLRLIAAGDAYVTSNDKLYDGWWYRLIATLPGFAVVSRRFGRDRTDPLAIMAIAGVLVYALGAATGESHWGRVLPLVVLPAHIGWGLLLHAVWQRHVTDVRVVAWAAVSVVVGVVGIAPGLARTVPRALLPADLRDDKELRATTDDYDELRGVLPFGTLVLAETRQLGHVAPAYGLHVVVPVFAAAFVDDIEERQAAAAAILAGAEPEWDGTSIGAVLCETDACIARFAPGEVVARGRAWTLVRLPT